MATPEDLRADAAPKSDRREGLKARIIALVMAKLEILDVDLASVVGVLDRGTLRSLLAELVIDGQIAVVAASPLPGENVWLDGVAPWRVRLAPAGTPSLEDRIVQALAEAGVDGLAEEDLDDIVRRDVEGDHGEDIALVLTPGRVEMARGALIERGLVHRREHPVCGGETFTLSFAEWARRILPLVRASGAIIGPIEEERLAPAIARLLAGTESEAAPAVTPPSSPLRSGEKREA